MRHQTRAQLIEKATYETGKRDFEAWQYTGMPRPPATDQANHYLTSTGRAATVPDLPEEIPPTKE
jgi:hypothetical protein